MKSAIILHGKPSRETYEDPSTPVPSQNHWLGWLRSELGQKGFVVSNPEAKEPYNPQYDLWQDAIAGLDIDFETTLVGHSAGASFWLRYLSENPTLNPEKLILVAPWIDRSKYPDFFDFQIDADLSHRVLGAISIFNSLDDSAQVQNTVGEIQASLANVELREFTNRGHFTLKSMGTERFPELLQEVIS